MDGDKAPLRQISALCEKYHAHLIVDEAHATGVVGIDGAGLVQTLGLQNRCLARVHTFGKACGVHGAVVLGSENLRNYLVNFSRSFIFTTALPEISLAAIRASYRIFPELQEERKYLSLLINQFKVLETKYQLLPSETPIQSIVIPGNDNAKKEASRLQENGFDIRPILYPSVPKGAERLRIVLHSFNTTGDVTRLAQCLRK
ncbi:MAG: aminotransferase class I/II-fold pyridoxal phosphate-dependent enzyme, partial [Chitinophagaceae bacterium]